MAGKEREFMSMMDSTMANPRKRQQQEPVSFLEASNTMRDFWGLNTGNSDHCVESHHLQPAPGKQRLTPPNSAFQLTVTNFYFR